MPIYKSPAKKETVADKLKGVKLPKQRMGPLWAGPCGEGPQGGVTQSMLSRYLVCKERFRIMTIEGLKPAEKFNPPIDFGNMWHAAEEDHAAGRSGLDGGKLDACVAAYRKKFPLDQEAILHWYSVTAELFPVYAFHWEQHPDVKDRMPLLQEQSFDVPYRLPSGRTVRLRGKWDSVDQVGQGKIAGVWLQENKTKSSINRTKIERQLRMDLQTMIYLIALGEFSGAGGKLGIPGTTGEPIKGVRYNVIRRSAHKTTDSMLKKLNEDRADGRINEWFSRWSVEVSAKDVEIFKQTVLDPELENLCDDYEWWLYCKVANSDERRNVYDFALREKEFDHRLRHARRPFGLYDVLAEGGATDLDEHLASGSTAGLRVVDDLFPEISQ